MATLVWRGVFGLLVAEILIIAILAVPIPLKYRNQVARQVSKLNLGERLGKPILLLGVLLAGALLESFMTHRSIVERRLAEQEAGTFTAEHERAFHPYDTERRIKAERNMYLAAFALTLLFSIGRIATLMQESVELEEETERVRIFVAKVKEAEAKDKAGDKKLK